MSFLRALSWEAIRGAAAYALPTAIAAAFGAGLITIMMVETEQVSLRTGLLSVLTVFVVSFFTMFIALLYHPGHTDRP